MISPSVGMFFGFLNTATLHLAKGMQRQGIETLRWRRLARHERSRGKALIYIVGISLNNLSALWMVLANRFAPPAYATGMFGLGLVLLLFYSHFVLGERVTAANYTGAALIVVGTALFAVHAVALPQPPNARLDPRIVAFFAVGYLGLSGLAAIVTTRKPEPLRLALAFGLFTGGAASLDPVLKAVGQTAGGEATLLPSATWGWIPFALSFVLGTVSFLSVQYAFLRKADASAMVPVQTSTYVLVPMVVQILALPGYRASMLLAYGVVLIIAGIVLTQRKRAGVPAPAASHSTDSPTMPVRRNQEVP